MAQAASGRERTTVTFYVLKLSSTRFWSYCLVNHHLGPFCSWRLCPMRSDFRSWKPSLCELWEARPQRKARLLNHAQCRSYYLTLQVASAVPLGPVNAYAGPAFHSAEFIHLTLVWNFGVGSKKRVDWKWVFFFFHLLRLCFSLLYYIILFVFLYLWENMAATSVVLKMLMLPHSDHDAGVCGKGFRGRGRKEQWWDIHTGNRVSRYFSSSSSEPYHDRHPSWSRAEVSLPSEGGWHHVVLASVLLDAVPGKLLLGSIIKRRKSMLVCSPHLLISSYLWMDNYV